MADEQVMLTTIDNPYNPFTHYDEWNVYDETNLYFTNSLLARLTISSDELSERSQHEATKEAIDLIVNEDPLGIYIKVYPESSPKTGD